MLIDVHDVMNITGLPKSSSYKLITRLNSELEQQGYLTLRAKVNKTYLLERFGLIERGKECKTETLK